MVIRLLHYLAYKQAKEWDGDRLNDGFAVFKIRRTEDLDGFLEPLAGEYVAVPLSEFYQFREAPNVVFDEVTFYTRRGKTNEFVSYGATDI